MAKKRIPEAAIGVATDTATIEAERAAFLEKEGAAMPGGFITTEAMTAALDGAPLPNGHDSENTERLDTEFELQEQYPIPTDASFAGEEYRHAPDIEAIATALRAQYPKDFWHLKKTTIGYMWHRAGGMKNGSVVRVDTTRTPPKVRMFTHTEFSIDLSADVLRESHATPTQIRALVFHGLSHIGYNDVQDKCRIVDHDIVGFRREVEEFGFYQAELVAAADSFQAAFDLGDEDRVIEGDATILDTAPDDDDAPGRDVTEGDDPPPIGEAPSPEEIALSESEE